MASVVTVQRVSGQWNGQCTAGAGTTQLERLLHGRSGQQSGQSSGHCSRSSHCSSHSVAGDQCSDNCAARIAVSAAVSAVVSAAITAVVSAAVSVVVSAAIIVQPEEQWNGQCSGHRGVTRCVPGCSTARPPHGTPEAAESGTGTAIGTEIGTRTAIGTVYLSQRGLLEGNNRGGPAAVPGGAALPAGSRRLLQPRQQRLRAASAVMSPSRSRSPAASARRTVLHSV